MGFWYAHPPFLNIKYNPPLNSIITINAIIIVICELGFCDGGDEAEVVPKKKAPAKKSKSDDEAEESKVVKEKPAKKKTTGYVLFCQEFRPEVKEDNPGLAQVEITKLLAQMWKDLPEEEKEEWKEKAAAVA